MPKNNSEKSAIFLGGSETWSYVLPVAKTQPMNAEQLYQSVLSRAEKIVKENGYTGAEKYASLLGTVESTLLIAFQAMKRERGDTVAKFLERQERMAKNHEAEHKQ